MNKTTQKIITLLMEDLLAQKQLSKEIIEEYSIENTKLKKEIEKLNKDLNTFYN